MERAGRKNKVIPEEMPGDDIIDRWLKMCALLLFKCGKTDIIITQDDVTALVNSGSPNLIIRRRGDVIRLSLVGDEEANRLQRENENGKDMWRD